MRRWEDAFFASLLHNQRATPKWGTCLGRIRPSLKGVQCTVGSSKWGNFRVFYGLSGISLSTDFSTCYCCCWCFSEIAEFLLVYSLWRYCCGPLCLAFLIWLPHPLLGVLNWVTGQEGNKLWPKYQFQFPLHCIFFKTDDYAIDTTAHTRMHINI